MMRIRRYTAKQLGAVLGMISISIHQPTSPFSPTRNGYLFAHAFTPSFQNGRGPCHPRIQLHLFSLDASNSSTQLGESLSTTNASTTKSAAPMVLSTISSAIQLLIFSLVAAVTIIAWEDVSNAHPMRSYQQSIKQQQQSSTLHLGSTVRGLGFGKMERQRIMNNIPDSFEPESTLTNILSYNEVMLDHRTHRIPQWKQEITRQTVENSVRQLQMALLHVIKCESLVADYNWEELVMGLRDPILLTYFDEACDVLNRANDYLSLEARSEVGFDFGSCAWRHCGAFADVREAIDELDHLVGILEPFEANYVLDVAERGIRDMLAVTTNYHDRTISIPEYKLLQRKSDVNDGIESFDVDYLEALEFLKKLEETEAQGQQSL